MTEEYQGVKEEKEMTKRNSFRVFAVIFFCILIGMVAGCAKPPTQEIINAEKTLDKARAQDADFYAPDVFAQAEASLKEAKDLVAAKKYDEARKSAAEAQQLAEKAAALVGPNMEKKKAEAEEMVQAIEKDMEELKGLAARAVKKKISFDREELQGMIGKWEIDLIGLEDKIQSGQVRLAFNELKDLKDQVSAQKENIKALVEFRQVKKTE